jgi:hypothetical protein
MAIIVHCACGTALEAREEWRGRMVECGRCGQLVAVPAAGDEAAAGGLGNLWNEELAAGLTAPTAGPAAPQTSPSGRDGGGAWWRSEGPFQPRPSGQDPSRRLASQGRGIRGFFRRLFYVKKRIFQWAEPFWCRQRLRGEVRLRLALIAGVWGFLTGALLVPSAFPKQPPEPYWAILGATIVTFFALPYLMSRRSGGVTVTECDIRYEHVENSLNVTTTQWWEWPYSAIRRCVIVRGEAIGKRFAVMLLYDDAEVHDMCIPRKIDLERLREHLVSEGVAVEYGNSLPNRLTESPASAGPRFALVVGMLCLVGGLGFYLAETQEVRAERRMVAERDARRDEVFRERPRNAPPGGPSADRSITIPSLARPGRAEGEFGAPVAAEGLRQAAGDDAAVPGPAGGDPFGFPPSVPFPGGRFPSGVMRPGFPEAEMRFEERVPSPPRPPGGMAEWEAAPGPRRAMGSAPPVPWSPEGFEYAGPARGPSDSATQAALGTGATALVGGSGGGPFRMASETGTAVVGFRWRMGSWAGQAALGNFEPLFDRGAPPGNDQVVLAREGYAVGALEIEAPQFVQAVRIVFMRLQDDGRLDTSDSYTSDWIGARGQAAVARLEGEGVRVIGICGRRAAVLDALGLVLAEP